MLKIIVSQWDKNKDKLKHELETRDSVKRYGYKDLVKLVFEVIYNNGLNEYENDLLDLDRIHEIDDGDYQGTLLFLIPFEAYQPSECEYLMTYIGYGSCSVCDTLQRIRGSWDDEDKLTDTQVKDFMSLCKDILTNTVRPYNTGWRYDGAFEHGEEN